MKICPFLGLTHDPKTPALFPTDRNCCYQVRPLRTVANHHQEQYCLAGAHQTCPIFLNPEDALAREVLYAQGRRPRSRRLVLLALAALALLALALTAWVYRDAWLNARFKGSLPGSPVWISTPTLGLLSTVVTPTASGFAATILPSATPTHTLLPPLETSSVTPLPGLGTPIGSDPAFVIHRVVAGESLTILSQRYGTTETAIRAINLMLPMPLWENWLVVVPYQFEDVAGLPLFEVYQVKADGLSVAALAQQLNVDAGLMARYNHLALDDEFANGQWVLVAHMRR